MLIKNEAVLAKIESTYNTDSSPLAANAVAFSELSWSNEGLRMVERGVIQQGLDTLQRIYAGMLKTLTFTVELKGSGAAGTAPEFGPLLRACGLGETISASTSATYAPVSSSIESCTIYYYEDGSLHKMTGCRGNCNFDFAVGDVAKAVFTMTGHRADPTDATLASPVYDSTNPIGLINIPFTLGGDSLVVNGFNLDLANVIATPESLSATDGYSTVQITGRDPGGSLDPENVVVSTTPLIADFTGGVLNAISIGSIGGTAGNKVDLDLPKAYYVDATNADRQGVRTYDMAYNAAINTGDDEMSLVFT